MTYRLYVDEVGNGDLRAATKDPNSRYLSLTGYLAKVSTHDHAMQAYFDDFKKRHFDHTPGTPVILHRRELTRREGVFNRLHDPARCEKFDSELLEMIKVFPALALTVQIDKLEHNNKYQVWHADPYHYCMQCIMERYVTWLDHHKSHGDVYIESRSKEPDRRLTRSYESLYLRGTDYVTKEKFQRVLLTKKLQLRTKKANVAGLQIADLIAHPSARYMRFIREELDLPDDFGMKINDILLSMKYFRDRDTGRVDGIGLKWLP